MGENQGKKKFKLMQAILLVISVVFVAEAAAPVAAIGNSQFFWWIFLMLTFLLPYGMISSELGTTYEGEGGLYDWITKGLGHRWGARVAWYYWINFPLWLASLAVLAPPIFTLVFGIQFSVVTAIIFELVFIWAIILISFYPVSDSAWILNGSAIIKVALGLLIGGFGIYAAVNHGVANEYTVQSMLPSFDLNSLSFISVIIFNFLGFEVVCTFADDMENPKKQIPQAIVVGGLVIAAIYIFTAFGIGVAIPTAEISTSSGLIDSIQLLSGQTSGFLINAVAIFFFITLIGNMLSWSLGVNSVAKYAADNGDMPSVFGIASKKNDMPIGSAIMNGIVATLIIVVSPFIPNEDIFWSFFALNLVMFLVSYLPMFPAFLRLRKVDAERERPYKVAGSEAWLKVLAVVPMIMLVVSLIFVAVPLSFDAETLAATLPITIGAIIAFAIGEIILKVKKIENVKEEKPVMGDLEQEA